MVTINLKGREIPLLYTTWEMKTIQEEIAPNDKIMPMLLGKDPEDINGPTNTFASADHLMLLAKLVRILGNAGLEEAGEEPDLTNKKVLRALHPRELVSVVNTCIDAINEGFLSEIPDKEDDGPVDVILEEIEKKKEKDE